MWMKAPPPQILYDMFNKLVSSHHPSSIFWQIRHRSPLLTACPRSAREKEPEISIVCDCVCVCVCQTENVDMSPEWCCLFHLQYFPKGWEKVCCDSAGIMRERPVFSISVEAFQEMFASALGSALQPTGWTEGKIPLCDTPVFDFIKTYVQCSLGVPLGWKRLVLFTRVCEGL